MKWKTEKKSKNVKKNIYWFKWIYLSLKFKYKEISFKYFVEDKQNPPSKHSTPTHQPPVMSLGEGNEEVIKQHAKKVVNENLIMLIEENRSQEESSEADGPSTSSVSDDSPIYFR